MQIGTKATHSHSQPHTVTSHLWINPRWSAILPLLSSLFVLPSLAFVLLIEQIEKPMPNDTTSHQN